MPYLLFIIMMILIYTRPFRIPAWLISTFGAFVALLCGIVNVYDIAFVWAMVWDSTLVLVGLIVLTLALERILFFDFLAHQILSFAGTQSFANGKRIFCCPTWKLFI
ncbi:MAG: arsenic transporter, partial [Helicobacter sp.]|nr:arsenic transporter [Helicobacter sp.]